MKIQNYVNITKNNFMKISKTFSGKCVTADLGYVGCVSDVQHLADKKCSGRRECQISIPDEDFDNTQPCLTELKFYFEANYTCMKSKRFYLRSK